jgi:hypothetical protein
MTTEKKDAEPTIRARTIDVWDTLTDLQRAEMIEQMTELALARIEALAQARSGSGIPSGWFSVQWRARGGDPLSAFVLAAKESGS